MSKKILSLILALLLALGMVSLMASCSKDDGEMHKVAADDPYKITSDQESLSVVKAQTPEDSLSASLEKPVTKESPPPTDTPAPKPTTNPGDLQVNPNPPSKGAQQEHVNGWCWCGQFHGCIDPMGRPTTCPSPTPTPTPPPMRTHVSGEHGEYCWCGEFHKAHVYDPNNYCWCGQCHNDKSNMPGTSGAMGQWEPTNPSPPPGQSGQKP